MYSDILALVLLISAERVLMTLSLQNDSNEVAYLCPGEKYFIVCCTNQTYLQWVIQVPTYNYSLTCDLGINVSSPVDNCLWWHNNIEDTAINCTKNSEPEVLPLTSTLLINSTNTSFNRTVVECNEGYTLNNIPDCHNYSCYNYSIESISIRSIHVINDSVPPEFEVTIISVGFGITNVTVTMEWTPSSRDDVWYNVTIATEAHVDVVSTWNTSIQLVALYNTLYNVSIIASSALCNTGIGRLGFKYTNCGPPSQGFIFPYNSTAQGSRVMFICQQAGNLSMTKTMTAVCNHSGNWDPNPATVCESESSTKGLYGASLAGVMTGLGAVYILSLVAFCVCGFVCGWCTLKHKEFIQHTVTSYKAERQAYMMHPPPRHPAPVYEDTKLQPDESDSELHLVNAASHESEQQAYSTTLKCPTLVYENVSPVHGEAKSEQQAYSKCPTLAYENVSPLHGEAKTSTIEIQLQDLEMKKNVAYGPVRD